MFVHQSICPSKGVLRGSSPAIKLSVLSTHKISLKVLLFWHFQDKPYEIYEVSLSNQIVSKYYWFSTVLFNFKNKK